MIGFVPMGDTSERGYQWVISTLMMSVNILINLTVIVCCLSFLWDCQLHQEQGQGLTDYSGAQSVFLYILVECIIGSLDMFYVN